MKNHFTVLLLYLAALSPIFAGSTKTLNWLNPLPQGNQLNAVAYGDGSFVAVGQDGTILSSPDAINWCSQTLETPTLNAVAHGNGLFIAVGEQGTILTSSNGMNWARQNSPTTNGLLAITFGANRFVTVGRCLGESCDTFGDIAMVSSDGLTWSLVDLQAQFGFGFDLQAITYGSGTFVAIGNGIVTSTNGTDWVAPNPEVYFGFNCVTFSTNGFVALTGFAGALISVDGQNWVYHDTVINAAPLAVIFANNVYITVGLDGAILTSPNEISWTAQQSATDDMLLGIAFGKGLFVAVGENGQILTSDDATSWISHRSGTTDWLVGITHGNGLYVTVAPGLVETLPGGRPLATGRDGIVTSKNGTQWLEQQTGTTNMITGVAYAGKTFIIFGHKGLMITSPDGSTWGRQNSITSNSIYGVAYGDGLYVAVGGNRFTGRDGVILTSPDAIAWSVTMSAIPNSLQGVAFHLGRFVAVGDGGIVLSSRNGLVWSASDSETTNTLLAITSGLGLFVAVGERGTVLVSAGGTKWKKRDTLTEYDIGAIAFGNGVFAALPNGLFTRYGGGRVGFEPIGNLILTSRNTLNWETGQLGTLNTLKSIVAVNGNFLMVGDRGTILQLKTRPFGRFQQPNTDSHKDSRQHHLPFGMGQKL